MLEIGGGIEAFTDRLEKSGFEAYNYDLSAGSMPKGKFDLICHFFVLEHQPSPLKWLSEQVELLKLGGKMVVEVPNFEENPIESLNNEHLNHFRPADLKRLFNEVGLSFSLENRTAGMRNFGMTAVGTKNLGTRGSSNHASDVSDQIERYGFLAKEVERVDRKLLQLEDKYGHMKDVRIGIWPANQFTLRVLQSLEKIGLRAHVIVDSDPEKQGLDWGGAVSVVSASAHQVRACDLFLNLSEEYRFEITESLLALGFEEMNIEFL